MPAKIGGRVSGTGNSPGSSNFYARVLDEAEQLDFERAAGLDGIDEEITLLRVKIKSILGDDPGNIKLLVEATNALERLIRTRYKISKEQRKGLKDAIGNVLRDIALPLGIGIGTALDKKSG
ncbi:MAG: hypothetical protein PHR56_03455 [Dehalococcoidales bacterium]|nr:hypothetical protein [Dehalococcoidales bacterium]